MIVYIDNYVGSSISGRTYKEWELDYGTHIGHGFHNTGTRRAPVVTPISSTKIKIALKPDSSNPRGCILDSAYPSYP